MDAVFISYRRGDRPDAVDRICQALAEHLPNQKVFRDIHDIPLGTNFPELLRKKLGEVSAVMVIIGPRWLEILKERRTDSNDSVDFVREEVRIALESDVRVIPVTVDGEAMPSKADLAEFPDLLPLLHRNGTAVRPALDFTHDIERLVKKLADPCASESDGAILEGKYRLIREIGESGMGKVFEAEQTQPVRRQVAIKLIKLGMDTKEVLARFAAEMQALAVMDHPNIARVHDGGMTPLGRPYFVMELVQGKPITVFCDAKRLSIRERLALFDSVCHAVHHAHQKMIIHRDIKPSNVLVEEINGQHVLKLIDFGLAKAMMGQRLTEKPWFSESGKQIGTLEYMSPEQAEGKDFDIDTRSDIYSLGILLYELLAGRPPFCRQELLEMDDAKLMKVLREEDPPRPSIQVSSAAYLEIIAAKRNLQPARLAKLIRGDLDRIVMKCIEKGRARRYQTALELAQDVERYLGGERVAKPPRKGLLHRASNAVSRWWGTAILQSPSPLGTAFISYRRAGGAGIARVIRTELASRGWKIFLDVEDLDSCYFDERLLHEIENSINFIIILSQGCLDYIKSDDWLVKEIQHALLTKRRIIPVLMDRFNFPSPDRLPISIQKLSSINSIIYSHVYHTASIDKVHKWLQTESSGTIPSPPGGRS